MLTPLVVLICVGLTVSQPDPNDPCRDCRIENGVGYKEAANDCGAYFICQPLAGAAGQYTPTQMRCGCNQYWNQGLLTCTHAGDSGCPTDPCATGAGNNRTYIGNCRAYWRCSNSLSTETMCCPVGQGFSAADGRCVVDGTCSDPCPCDQPETTTGSACPFTPILGERAKYLWTYGNGQAATMDCPIGLAFNEVTCWCDLFIDVTIPPCPPTLSILYTEMPPIDHGQRSWLDVRSLGNNGDFNGNARILVPRFSNIEWPETLALDVEFNGQGNTNNDGPLLDNCDCNEPSSVSLRLTGPNTLVYQQRMHDGAGGFTTTDLTASYNANSWNRVKVAFDGANIVLQVTSAGNVVDSDSATVTGRIAPCQCGLQVGYRFNNVYYQGLMRRTDMYFCLPANFIS